VAVASASPTIGDAPLTVNFSSAGSNPGTGTDVLYLWDFGDGTPIQKNQAPSHVYENVGPYTARLTIQSSAGSSTSPGIAITVNQDPNPKYYVKLSGSTGAGCGPINNPCSTITEAQANAVANGIHNIRVAGGSYNGPLALASNMNITGGWEQDFSDFGPTQVTTIYGTSTAPAVTIDGVADSAISGVSAQGIARTTGDATGVVVSNSSGIEIGDTDSPQTIVAGGSGPNATGVLVSGGSNVVITNAKVNSGTPTGEGSSAYGVRAIGLSVVNISLSEVVAQPGIAGQSASSTPPAQATAGCAGARGADASGPSSPGNGGAGGGCATYSGGNGGRGGDYSSWGDNGTKGSGPTGGWEGSGGCGSLFGCDPPARPGRPVAVAAVAAAASPPAPPVAAVAAVAPVATAVRRAPSAAAPVVGPSGSTPTRPRSTCSPRRSPPRRAVPAAPERPVVAAATAATAATAVRTRAAWPAVAAVAPAAGPVAAVAGPVAVPVAIRSPWSTSASAR
jgi:PKD repeat protein